MATKAAAQAPQGASKPADAKIAVRTCIGCRKVAAREQLIRLVGSTNNSGEKEALVDLRRRLPGRGAWLHPNPDCWKLAIKRRAIGRALPGVTNVSGAQEFADNKMPFVADTDIRT